MLGSLVIQFTFGGADVLPSEKLPLAASVSDAPSGSGGSCAAVAAVMPCGSTDTLCSTGVPTPSVSVPVTVP